MIALNTEEAEILTEEEEAAMRLGTPFLIGVLPHGKYTVYLCEGVFPRWFSQGFPAEQAKVFRVIRHLADLPMIGDNLRKYVGTLPMFAHHQHDLQLLVKAAGCPSDWDLDKILEHGTLLTHRTVEVRIPKELHQLRGISIGSK